MSASAPPVKAGIWLSNSFSIHLLWMVKVLRRQQLGSGAKAGSRTTARWNGSAVAMPSTVSSSSARRERSSASCRDEPNTISLASSESNWPPMTSPACTPVSTRTPGPSGDSNGRDGARCREEVASRVLAVDPELERVAALRRVVERQRLAVGDPELPAHQVDAGDLLGDRVLDLQPGVDLEEGDQPVLGDEELDGAGTDVAGLQADLLAGVVQALPLLLGEERRRAPPRPASGSAAAASSRGCRRRRPCPCRRPAPASRRGGDGRGSARRSIRRGRTRRPPRARRCRRGRRPPRARRRPSARAHHRRRRP